MSIATPNKSQTDRLLIDRGSIGTSAGNLLLEKKISTAETRSRQTKTAVHKKTNSRQKHTVPISPHTPSRGLLTGSPTHEHTSQMNKRNLCETFCEDVSELIGSFNFDDGDAVGRFGDVLAEPMILDGVVLRSWRHSSRFKVGQGEGTDVVLMNPGVEVGGHLWWEANGLS